MKLAEITHYLELLDAELVDYGVVRKIHLLVVGGVFMIATIGNREATQDIDCWIFDPTFHEREYEQFKGLVDFIAQEQHLHPDWLNDKVADFLSAAGNQQLPPRFPWKENHRFRVLEIYFPAPDYILALKLMAARSKDMQDIPTLLYMCNISTKQQAKVLLDHYIAQDIQKIYQVEEKLQRVFPV